MRLLRINWPPTATQPPIATNMAWYVTVNPVASLGGTMTPRAPNIFNILIK